MHLRRRPTLRSDPQAAIAQVASEPLAHLFDVLARSLARFTSELRLLAAAPTRASGDFFFFFVLFFVFCLFASSSACSFSFSFSLRLRLSSASSSAALAPALRLPLRRRSDDTFGFVGAAALVFVEVDDDYYTLTRLTLISIEIATKLQAARWRKQTEASGACFVRLRSARTNASAQVSSPVVRALAGVNNVVCCAPLSSRACPKRALASRVQFASD